jgi:LPS export ABC transporter protein LptC
MFFPRHIIIVLVAAMLCCAALSACENNINEVRALSNKGLNSETSVDIESYLSVGGKLKARLTSPLMLKSEKDTTKMTFPKTLHVIFYDDSTGLPSSFVFAKYGVYYQTLNKIELRDSVIATNIEGDTLRTNELWWDQNKQMIYGSQPALLVRTHPYDVTPGQGGFSGKQDFSQFVFNDVNHSISQLDSSLSF